MKICIYVQKSGDGEGDEPDYKQWAVLVAGDLKEERHAQQSEMQGDAPAYSLLEDKFRNKNSYA